MHDDLDIAAVHSSLAGTRFAGGVEHVTAIASTNSALTERAAAGAPAGTVLVADAQTAGRGRGGHAWHSTPGAGLYVSVLVRPALTLRDALPLSLATGLAAWQAVHELTELDTDLRWPNDLLLAGRDGRLRKCGGILVETAAGAGEDAPLRYAVIGIGLNIHHTAFPAELADAATSLAMEAAPALAAGLSRTALLMSLLHALESELTRIETTESDMTESRQELLARFTAHSTFARGRRVHVAERGGYTGTTAGLDAAGFLRVVGDDGVVRTVLSGGVRELSNSPAE